MIYIVGLGPGHKDYIMPKALETMKKSEIIVGFKRAIDSLDFIQGKKIYMKKLSDIDEFILNNDNIDNCEKSPINISIIASGDPTFYGITNYVKSKAQCEFEIIPGISSFQYLTSKVKLPWNTAHLGSLHGRSDDFLKEVKDNNLSIWLTDKENNPAALCKVLEEAKIKCRVIIGENLSYEDEIITIGSPSEFLNKEFSILSILIVERI